VPERDTEPAKQRHDKPRRRPRRGAKETLRGALQATKASGQPDWPTRVAAVKALAALRPDAVEQVEPEQPTPSIVVYDLPPGAGPVVHQARSGGETPVGAADTPPAKQPPESLGYMFSYDPPDALDLAARLAA
jgi:hypothetical protein